jgi:hypothetical protein
MSETPESDKPESEPSETEAPERDVEPALYTPPDLGIVRKRALFVALGGAALCALGAALDPTQFLRSYLIAFVLWLSVALGCFALVMLQHVATGGWGVVLRRTLEAASRTIPRFALLFAPIVIGLPRLYPWARPEVVREDHLIAHKAAYLNAPFFIGRAVFYFVVWAGFAFMLSRLSLAQDRSGDARLSRKMRLVSAGGLVFYCLTTTFAAIDWLMSLSPHWYSSIFGVYVVGGQAVAAMSFAILAALYLARQSSMAGALKPRHFHDFGKLLLAFVMLWSYFALSQFLVIWAGNLPEDIPFFTDRLRGGWNAVSLGLVLFHFALPFMLLLSRDLKRSAPKLAAVAGLLLVMRWVDIYWLVAPAFHPGRLSFHWLDIVAPVAVGGAFVHFFAGELATRPLLPVREPLLKEALEHG